MTQGRATPEGTARFRSRFAGAAAPDHFREARGLWLSSIGLGTYLGEPTTEDDHAYADTSRRALLAGVNVLDTAINYRFQRSERSIGAALAAAFEAGEARRDEIVVATKGGFLPFDGAYPADPRAWVEETFVRPGIAAPEEIAAGCHCMAPGYIDHQFETSRRNLGLETIDIYYVHNPETQLGEVPRREFLSRLGAAFEVLERKASEGRLGWYGTATWDGYRAAHGTPGHLSLAEVLAAAEEAAVKAGSGRHRFAAVQAPLNLAMPEAVLHPNQDLRGGTGRAPLLEAARADDLIVMASGSLLQGHLIRRMPAQFAERIPGGKSLAQKALQWARSAPGIATALVGMRSGRHLQENAAVAAFPRMTSAEWDAMLAPRG